MPYVDLMHSLSFFLWGRTPDLVICFTSRGGGLGSRTIFKKFNEPYAPS